MSTEKNILQFWIDNARSPRRRQEIVDSFESFNLGHNEYGLCLEICLKPGTPVRPSYCDLMITQLSRKLNMKINTWKVLN